MDADALRHADSVTGRQVERFMNCNILCPQGDLGRPGAGRRNGVAQLTGCAFSMNLDRNSRERGLRSGHFFHHRDNRALHNAQ
jgi:hypothetical protein